MKSNDQHSSQPAAGTSAPVPFVDDRHSSSVAGLTVEYLGARIALYGQTELSADQHGLAQAEALRDWAQSLVDALRQQSGLPERLEPAATADSVANPFL